VHVCILLFSLFYLSFVAFPSVLWYCWLGFWPIKTVSHITIHVLCWRGRKTLLNPIQCQNQRPWMTLKVIMHSVSKQMHHGVAAYLYSFTFNTLPGSEWLQRMLDLMLARPVLWWPWPNDLSEPEANNNRRVIGRRKNTLHRAVSLREHGSCILMLGCNRAYFLADRTNGLAYATVLRLSSVCLSVCDVMYCG